MFYTRNPDFLENYFNEKICIHALILFDEEFFQFFVLLDIILRFFDLFCKTASACSLFFTIP